MLALNELFSSLLQIPVWSLVLAFTLLIATVFGVLWAILRPAIVSLLDPMSIRLFSALGFAVIGFVFSPALGHSFSNSYWTILFFLFIWLMVIRFFGRPISINLRDGMDADFQMVLLAIAITVILLNFLFNMVIPGKIPLFMESGSAERFTATENNRLLTWLNFGTAPIGGVLYALTEKAQVRRFAGFAVMLQVLQSILFASKGGILAILFILLNALFVAQQRGERTRSIKLRQLLKRTAWVIVCSAPFYLATIGIGNNGGSLASAIAMRVLGTFDQLILVSQSDLITRSQDLFQTNILQYQFMPLFKVLSDHRFPYSSVGQYVIEAATGVYVEGAFTMPNSNLILEVLFTSGFYGGLVIFVLELSCFYWFRFIALKRVITPFILGLVITTVFDPFGLFFSGQEWMVETVLVFLVIGFACFLTLGVKTLRNVCASVRLQAASGLRLR